MSKRPEEKIKKVNDAIALFSRELEELAQHYLQQADGDPRRASELLMQELRALPLPISNEEIVAYLMADARLQGMIKKQEMNDIVAWEIEKKDGYTIARCPNCHTQANEDEYTGQPILSNYCPECGRALKV